MWQYNYTDELSHYGVLGMKWGVRKDRIRTLENRAKEIKKIKGTGNDAYISIKKKLYAAKNKENLRDARDEKTIINDIERRHAKNKARTTKILSTVGPIAISALSAAVIAGVRSYVARGEFGLRSVGFDGGPLTHHGILGMKWGVRRTPAQLGHLTKKDNKWVKKNTEKITEKARKKSSKELMKYANELMKDPNAVNKSGKLSAATINSYNKKMASLMNEQVSDLTSPSGKVVRFVAKRGEVGVFMALADQGYNMNQLKNGIYDSGKVAYKNTVIDKIEN